MAGVHSFGLTDGRRLRRGMWWVCAVAAWFGLGAAGMVAQDVNTSVPDATVPTLHVYTNVVQVPTLVLRNDRRPLPAPVSEGKFFVSFDGQAKFKVTHVRLEGDDPIALLIVLDLRQPYPQLMDHLDGAAAGLAPTWLTAKDRVSIYASECNLVRSAAGAAVDAAALAHGVDRALDSWKMRKQDRVKGNCENPWNLWDSLAVVIQEMQRERGRRAVLVVTDGNDRGSKTTWSEVREAAQQGGVAIFGVIQPGDVFASLHSGFPSTTNTLNALCELSGGMVLTATPGSLARQLEFFTALLRGRYIVEFPRPWSTMGGSPRYDDHGCRPARRVYPAGGSYGAGGRPGGAERSDYGADGSGEYAGVGQGEAGAAEVICGRVSGSGSFFEALGGAEALRGAQGSARRGHDAGICEDDVWGGGEALPGATWVAGAV